MFKVPCNHMESLGLVSRQVKESFTLTSCEALQSRVKFFLRLWYHNYI